MNGLEIYNEILENTHNLKGTWEVTAENYLKVDGMTNGSIVLFDKTVGALGDFILEWTAEQKGGSYIHSNLCPSLRYTPEDAGTEGGGDNYSLLVYLCNYGGNPGTFNFRTESGTKSEINTSGVSLNIDTVYTFKLERLNGMYRLYQDGVLINEATDITKKKLYLGWYLWYGGSNADYQTNFILREYNLTKIDTKSYLDSIGLTSLWSKIKSLFATKAELASKANDNDVVHKTGEETITNKKTFTDGIYGKYIEFTQNSGENHGGFIDFHYAGSTEDNTSRIIENAEGNLNINGCDFKNGVMSGTATKATQDSDGNQINTTYLPLSGGTLTGNLISNKEIQFKDLTYNWEDTSLDRWCSAGHITWNDSTGKRRMHELIGVHGGVWRKSCYINENQYFSIQSDLQINFWGNAFRFNGKLVESVDSQDYDNADRYWIRYTNGLQIVTGTHYPSSIGYEIQMYLPVPFMDDTYRVIISPCEGNLSSFLGTTKATTYFNVTFENSNGIEWIAIGRWK